MNKEDRLISRQEVEVLLGGVSRSTIYRMIDAKVLPAPVKLGRLLRWRSEDIEAYLKTLK